jgi:plasmid stability protein
MAQLTVRRLSRQIIDGLKQRAAANGRSAEAEHREVLRQALLPAEGTFAERAREMRQRLASCIDSTDTIRADRDRDGLP